MEYRKVDSVPKSKATMYEERRKRIKDMLVEIYDSGIEYAEVEYRADEFPSVTRMTELFKEEARRTARDVICRREIHARPYTYRIDDIFVISRKANLVYINVKHRITAEDKARIENEISMRNERIAERERKKQDRPNRTSCKDAFEADEELGQPSNAELRGEQYYADQGGEE